MKKWVIAGAVLLAMTLSACAAQATQAPPPTPEVIEELPTATVADVATQVAEPQATSAPDGYDPKVPDSWKQLPVIPTEISDKMKAVYAAGQNGGGLNARAFSKIGDCETSSDFFLKPFDLSSSGYDLGEYSDLQGVIDHFEGSFGWKSLAAQPGFSISSVFSSLWADSDTCLANEWPIDCEIRVHRPAFALVMFGTNDVHNTRPTFKKNLEGLVDKLLKNDVVPILVTKADNLEGDNSINAIIAQVAYEKEVPVLNYWRAAQELPDQGLEADKIHLTYAAPRFSDPEAMKFGWPWRNLTALQALDAVWRGVGGDQ
jgi:hypothetical protein